MGNRKDKPITLRFLSSIAAFFLIGSIVYILIAGINFYSGAILAFAVLGLGAPSVVAGESFLDVIAGFFEALLDGIMEVVGGIFDVITSIFS